MDGNRAGEYVKLYESLGDKARAEPETLDRVAVDERATCLLTAFD
jgi:hypothetical protein